MRDELEEEVLDMQMQRPAWKSEINYTTVIAFLTLGMTIIGMSIAYGRFTSRVDVLERDAQTWRDSHLVYHRERAQEAAASTARADERLKTLEAEARQMDRMEYRLTVQEQGTTSLTAAVAELRQTINDQSGDIRLIREIVQRLDGGEQNGR